MALNPTEEFTRQLSQTLEKGLTEESAQNVKRQAQGILNDVLEDVQWRLECDAASNIAYHVQDLFKKGFEAMLNGNEEEFRRWIFASGYTGREYSHLAPVVHRQLFDTGPIELRRQLVEAYPELLRNERIADLECQVEALVKQVSQLEARNSRLDQYADDED